MFIRKAELSDVSKIAEIHVLAWQTAYIGHMPKDFLAGLSIEKRIIEWQVWINEPGPGTTIVVEDFDEPKGFCVFGPTRDNDLSVESVGEILALNVHPTYWRHGYGKCLCDSVLNEAKNRNWNSLTLWMLKENNRANSFYKSLGFERDGAERIESIAEGATIKEVRYYVKLYQ